MEAQSWLQSNADLLHNAIPVAAAFERGGHISLDLWTLESIGETELQDFDEVTDTKKKQEEEDVPAEKKLMPLPLLLARS